MIKEIKYNGFTETPSDYECPDGDLATVTGLVPEDEALHPVLPPVSMFTLPDGYTVCFVHANTSAYKHYIIRRDYSASNHDYSAFYWIDTPTGAAYDATAITANHIITFEDKEIYEVNAIGNTLLFLTSDGMYYSLWKFDKQQQKSVYKNLGNHIPESKITFGLQGNAAKDEAPFTFDIGRDVKSAEADAEYPNTPFDKNCTFKTDDFINSMTDHVLPYVNKFIQERSVDAGKFIFPFFVRWAYKLYDESIVMHSAPILMIPDSQTIPHAFLTGFDTGTSFDTGPIVVLGAMLCDLDYQAVLPANISDWSDIVKSVEVYISAPIYSYNYQGKIKSWSYKNYDERGYGIFNLPSDDAYYNYDIVYFHLDTSCYNRWFTSKLLYDGYTGTQLKYNGKQELDLPSFSEEEMVKKIKSCQNFYLLKSIPIENLSTESRAKIDIPEKYLSSLTDRDAMTDDLNTHNIYRPKLSFTYNSRLNIADISMLYKNPFKPSLVAPMFDKYYADYGSTTAGQASYHFYIYIIQDDKEMVIRDDGNAVVMGNMGDDSNNKHVNPFVYFFYPNANANKVVVERVQQGESPIYYELPLVPHDFLNGAVYYEGFRSAIEDLPTAPVVTSDNTIAMPNKLYTSEVDNPFVFLPAGMRTIGISSIIGIRPAVKAMSPSQYGQFKFYVFTNDGVWALEVSAEGYLQQPSLVAPDIVLLNSDGKASSITQIDGAVLFASNRGIMMLDGSQCACVSDTLNSQDPFVPFATDAADDVLPGLRAVVDQSLKDIAPVPFRTFIADCSMLYDYTHQRIILYSPSYNYAYAFSLKSKLWGMIPSAIRSTVLDYPNATAMIDEVQVVHDEEHNTDTNVTVPALADYSQDPADTGSPAAVDSLIITRPLKLDMPDVLKTIDTVIQRGQFKRGHVQSVLYGSRDLEHWFLVKSSVDQYLRGFRGTPYKYFRIALICQLDKEESLYGCSISLTPRYQNQLR